MLSKRQATAYVLVLLAASSLQQQAEQDTEFSAAGLIPQTTPAPAHRSGVCTDECYARATCNEELGGRCDCPKTLAGWDCHRSASPSHLGAYGQAPEAEARTPMPCLNNCTRRGACVMGSCVCTRGNFGSDCSASLAPAPGHAASSAAAPGAGAGAGAGAGGGVPVLLAGSGYTPRVKRPRVYVYDVPHKFSSWHSPFRVDRGLHWVFWERLLGSGVQVADGEEADWFFIPVKLRTTSDGYRLLECIRYLRRKWPWYDRLHGNRHFVMHLGDTGRGEVSEAVRKATANVSWLHHWGLTEDYPTSGWRKAHRPGKDIVVPIYFGARQGQFAVPMSGLHPRAPRLPRRGTLLFAGRLCGDHSDPDPAKPWPHCKTDKSPGYSQGVRQMVHFHHHNRTGYKLVVSDPDYTVDLLNYKWCLSPAGGGHGHRQTLAAVMGCLPLVVSDLVMQPFEPEMDWGAIGLRLAHEAIPRLHAELGAVGEAAYAERQDALLCAAQHLVFSTSGGAFMQEDGRYDAFEMVLEILRMQQTYPGLDPKRYAETDSQFRAFTNCGDPEGMAAYGRKLRAVHEAAHPSPPALSKRRAERAWRDLYKKGGLEKLLDRHEAAAAEGPPLRLCSMSRWDPLPARCEQQGFRRRVQHAFVPGGAACVHHDADLTKCPRLWP